MIKPGALVMAAAMAAVSAGTYFGLDLLPPGALPEPIGRAQKPEPPKPGESAFAAAPATSTAAAAPAVPAEEPKPAEQPVTEQDLAEDPPPPPAPAPAAEPQAKAEPEPAPAEPAPAPAPKPQAKTAPALVDEPAPAPAPKAAAAKPKPKVEIVRDESPSTPTQTASAEPATPAKPKAAPADADVIKPWWPDSSKVKPNQLRLQYAGQVKGENAIALLFSAPLNLDALKQHAQVKAASGQAVNGEWQLGKNPQLAVFRGVSPGRYTVILAPEVADAKGFMLGMTLKGPVYIQPP